MSQDFSFKVYHDHNPWGKCIGEMTVSPSGKKFESVKEEHSIELGWTDIQSLERKSLSEVTILTYDDQKLLAGRDRPLSFLLLKDSNSHLKYSV